MSGYDSFEADPVRLAAAISEIESIAAEARSIVDNFRSGVAVYNGWEGTDDDYAREAGAKYDENVDSVIRTGEAIADAIESVVYGRLAELRQINTAQGYAEENIGALLAETGDIGSDSSGGGRH